MNFIVGPLTSGASLGVAQSVTIPAGVILISSAASSPALTGVADKDTLFRTYPSDLLQAEVLVKAIATAFRPSARVTIGAVNNAFGTGLAKAFKRAWVKQGGTVAGTVLWDRAAASYDSEAAALVKTRQDAFVFIDYPDSFAKMAPALVRTKKWDQKVTFMTEAFNNAKSISTVGAELMEGIRGTSAKNAGTDAAGWGTAFKVAYPKNPGTFVDGSAFDAVVLACLAGIYAGSTATKALIKGLRAVGGVSGGTSYAWDKLKGAVTDAAAGKPITYEGVWGYTKFDKKGDPMGGLFELWSIKDGIIIKDATKDVKF